MNTSDLHERFHCEINLFKTREAGNEELWVYHFTISPEKGCKIKTKGDGIVDKKGMFTLELPHKANLTLVKDVRGKTGGD